MGQMTECLKATKELRKQFVKRKPKKVSKRDRRVIDAVMNSDFGCQKENAFIFAEAIAERKIPRPMGKRGPKFDGVKGSLLCFEHPRDSNSPALAIDDDLGEHRIRWVGKNGGPASVGREREFWRPATDKEIREYFS